MLLCDMVSKKDSQKLKKDKVNIQYGIKNIHLIMISKLEKYKLSLG